MMLRTPLGSPMLALVLESALNGLNPSPDLENKSKDLPEGKTASEGSQMKKREQRKRSPNMKSVNVQIPRNFLSAARKLVITLELADFTDSDSDEGPESIQ